MALISIRKTAAIEPSPTDTVSLYVDASDNHLKQIDETGEIIDLTDGSATSSPNAASLVNTTKAALVTLLGGGLANIKATYRITDATDGIIRVTAKTASLLTATAMKEGSDDGGGTVTAGEWGNYDLDADVFTSSYLSKEGTSDISNNASFSQGDPSSLQSILTFAEDFTMKSIDNSTGNYAQAYCNPSTFEMSSFAGGTSKRIVISSSNGNEIDIQSDDAQIVKFAESSGEARIGFFTKFSVPVAQEVAIANATDAPSAITQLNLLLTAMRNYGLIAS